MARRSAGVLLYRRIQGNLEVLLVHPGGPFWVHRDDGAWSIPKGEVEEGEELVAAARREFHEETGTVLNADLVPLGFVRLKSGKKVVGFAAEGDLDPASVHSTTFEAEWPPRSGSIQTYPEVDRAGFFSLEEASRKIHVGQLPFLTRLAELLLHSSL